MQQPVIIDGLVCFSLRDLSRLGLLQRDSYKSISVSLIRGNNSFNIQVAASTYPGDSFIQLEYEVDQEPVKYKIPLIQVPNNIGERFSACWYFVCPFTDQKSKKLHFNGTYFIHRTGINNGYYYQQTLSKNQRNSFSQGKKLRSLKEIISKSSRKYFISHYDKEETKAYQRIKKAQKQIEMMAMNN